jgi:hypothetical protein
MLAAVRAEKIQYHRGVGQLGLAFFVLAVKNPQRVGLYPSLAIFAKPVLPAPEEILDLLLIGKPTGRVSQGIDLEADVLEFQGCKKAHQHDQNFRVSLCFLNPQDLSIDLMELAVPPLLRAFVPEHGPDEIIFAHGLLNVKTMLEVGTHDGGGGFGPQSQRIPVAVGKSIHFFSHDVRGLTDGPGKKLRPLQDRDAKLQEPEEAEDPPGFHFHVLPFFDFTRENSLEPPDSFDEQSKFLNSLRCFDYNQERAESQGNTRFRIAVCGIWKKEAGCFEATRDFYFGNGEGMVCQRAVFIHT